MILDSWLKKALPGVAGAMLAVAAYFQASGATQLLGAYLAAPKPIAPLKKRPALRVTELSAEPILARNPFDSVTGPLDGSQAEQAAEDQDDPDDEPLSDPYSAPDCDFGWVVLITASEDPSYSFASILKKEDNTTIFRRLGDKVADHTLHYLAADRLWLKNGSGHCQMKLGDKPEKVKKPRQRPTRQRPNRSRRSRFQVPPELAAKIHKVSDTEFDIDRSAVEDILENQFSLLRSTRVKPVAGKDGVKGLQMRRVRDGSLLHTLGVRDGDVVRAVNGFALTDPQKALQAYGKLRMADSLKLEIERGGKPTTIEFNIR